MVPNNKELLYTQKSLANHCKQYNFAVSKFEDNLSNGTAKLLFNGSNSTRTIIKLKKFGKTENRQ